MTASIVMIVLIAVALWAIERATFVSDSAKPYIRWFFIVIIVILLIKLLLAVLGVPFPRLP